MNVHHIVLPTEITEGDYIAIVTRNGKRFASTPRHKRTGEPLATVSRRHLADAIKDARTLMKEAKV